MPQRRLLEHAEAGGPSAAVPLQQRAVRLASSSPSSTDEESGTSDLEALDDGEPLALEDQQLATPGPQNGGRRSLTGLRGVTCRIFRNSVSYRALVMVDNLEFVSAYRVSLEHALNDHIILLDVKQQAALVAGALASRSVRPRHEACEEDAVGNFE